MNLTRYNYLQNLAFIQKSIKEANYVALDFEFTGVLASSLLRNSLLDSFQMRYWKVKENVRRFLPIQMGLCTFKEQLNSNSIIAHPFNFYIFPYGVDGYLDKQFQLSSNSISFLTNNNFDFNRTFNEGILYLSHQDEKIMRETKRISDLRNDMRYLDKIVTFEMINFINQYKVQVEQFLKLSDIDQFEIPIKRLKVKVYRHFIENIKKEFGKSYEFHCKYDSDVLIKREKLYIVKGPEPLETKKQNVEEVNEFAGVRVLLDQISQQKTPLILHNGLMDIMHVYDKFFETLPDSRTEFIIKVNQMFPEIYDTKFLINQSYSVYNKVGQFSELKNSFINLQNLEPNVVFGDECQEYNNLDENQAFEHEAGFDSYMAGSVFYKAKKLMNLDQSKLDLYKNKVPQSSIKIPFDFSDKTGEDKYHNKQIFIFHVEILEKNLVPDSLIKSYFKETYTTDIDLFLSYGQNFEYFMVFQTLEGSQQFRKTMKNGVTIIKIGDHEFIITEYENYVQKLQRRAKDELSIKEMPTILE
ncbi:unnamed protein product [Paramecium sonneborni]|uniref:Uncharacterized protein n=1 Tax=Paramecium sonneborni TaxID=65129 RepID=A0A8S1R936_9CILI|nr:unnamed protein product [Paramecium sonneborni]